METTSPQYFWRHTAILCLLFLGFEAQALSPSISRLSGSIAVDGKIDETAWETVEPLNLSMHWPEHGGLQTERTEIRITYDDTYLYVGAKCFDSDPSGIQAPTFQRDEWTLKMDQIGVGLDPYNDNENTLFFVVTPSGSRIDVAVKNDAQGNDAINVSWNSFWIANSNIDESGWQTEMRIPFSSLRFQEVDGQVNMGMIAYRYIARKKEMAIFPDIAPDWGFWSFAKASQAETIAFRGVQNRRPWYTSPYLLAGTGHHHHQVEGDHQKVDDRNLQLGLDVQHAFGDNLNADFTVNTDFAQVEADNQMINLSRFSLFFPEKRRFFLERASTFDFKFEGNNNMFYSRRIGISEGGLVPLYGGARLVGRLDKWDLGLINMQSQPIDGLLSENFGVLRLRRNVWNPRSYAGGMLTSRVDAAGNYNLAYGFDGIYNVFKQDYLKLNIAQTVDKTDTSQASGLDRSRVYLMWENRIINGFGYRFSYSNVGEHYNPLLGFEQRFNFSQFGDQLYYSWFAPEKSSLRQTTVAVDGNISLRNSTGNLETYTTGVSTILEWDRGGTLAAAFSNFHDNTPASFNLSDEILIAAGSYDNVSASLTFQTPPVSFASVNLSTQAGTFYGGRLSQVSVTPELVVSKYFQASAFYSYTFINFHELNDVWRSHLLRLNVATSLNVKLSLQAFVQFNSIEEVSGINLRIRYNPVDGNDLYLVYNETINSGTFTPENTLPFSESRAVLLKYIHTFML